MARKGSKKVRTGCLTCKIRKVKCDEGKPSCERCITTQRQCDGYAPARRQPEIRWAVGPAAPPPRQAVSVSELRSWGFFHHVVAPAVSGYVRSEFWTRAVLHVGMQEPAVRHAVLAVSSLYESFGRAADRNAFAIQQYNRSIRRLREVGDDAVVLVVCVLMMCVEFLQGNRDMAMQHCLHGLAIFRETTSSWARQNMFPIFCRLGVMPFLISGTAEPLAALRPCESTIVPPKLPTRLDQLQNSLFLLLPATVRYVHACQRRRDGLDCPELAGTALERTDLLRKFDAWYASYEAFQEHGVIRDEDVPALQALEIRWQLGLVWVDMAAEHDDVSYDRHLPKFQRIVELATLAIAATVGHARPTFLFEMGFVPLLNLVVVKCRDLCTRLAALHAMRMLGSAREGVWDVDVLYAVGQAIIEMENGVRVDAVPLRPGAKKETEAEVSRAMQYVKPVLDSTGKTLAVFRLLGYGDLYGDGNMRSLGPLSAGYNPSTTLPT